MLAKTITKRRDISRITSEESSLCCQSSGSRFYRRDKVSVMTFDSIMCLESTALVYNVFVPENYTLSFQQKAYLPQNFSGCESNLQDFMIFTVNSLLMKYK
jgi:hypothetical protein